MDTTRSTLSSTTTVRRGSRTSPGAPSIRKLKPSVRPQATSRHRRRSRVHSGSFVFCPSKSGDVFRTPRGAGDKKSVGARLDRSHRRDDARRLARDDDVPRVEEDDRRVGGGGVGRRRRAPAGAGVGGRRRRDLDRRFAPRGDSVVILMLDARRASTQLHARVAAGAASSISALTPSSSSAGRASASRGGDHAPDRGGTAWGLVPIEKDVSTFGIEHGDEDRRRADRACGRLVDVPERPRPLADHRDAGTSRMGVARVRPAAAEATIEHVLEIGRVGDDGTYTSDGLIATHGSARSRRRRRRAQRA